MNSTAHTVAKLSIQLGKLIAGVNTGLRDIPNGSGFNNVPDDKLLDSLVFRDTFSAVGATNRLHMPSSVLVTSIVPPFRCHSEDIMVSTLN